MSLKSNLRGLRNKTKLTQSQLADISDVSMTQISKIERGESKNPELSTIKKLCLALNCSADDLLFDRKISGSNEKLKHYLDKAMRLSPYDKKAIINIIHKFLIADDLRQMQNISSPEDIFETLRDERESGMEDDEIEKNEAMEEYEAEALEREQEIWQNVQDSKT